MANDSTFIRISISDNAWRIAAGLRGVDTIMREEQLFLTAGAAIEAKQTAQHFLDTMVYDAPPPKSAFDTRYFASPDEYLARNRTTRTRNAIKIKDPAMVAGEAVAETYIDKADYPAYFYALSLEYGLVTKPAYYPRPFWRSTKALMRIQYRMGAAPVARRIVTRIHGKFQ